MIENEDASASESETLDAIRNQVGDLPVEVVVVKHDRFADLRAEMDFATTLASERGARGVFWVDTDVTGDAFRTLGYAYGDPVTVRIADKTFRVPFAATFGAVAVGEPLLFIDSRGQVSFAINQGNFARQYSITPPVLLEIPHR